MVLQRNQDNYGANIIMPAMASMWEVSDIPV